MGKPLEKALGLAEEILELTSALSLTGQPDVVEIEIDEYTALIEERDPLVKELTELMREAEKDTDGWRALEGIVQKIFVMDKENRRIMEHTRGLVQNSMKELRSGRKLSNAYAHPLEVRVSSGRLDTRQ
ncbi:MAG: flagellar protein FliT [Clostridiales bacterium]|jgi:hypothetical protein|nr:flagellar protein FliT [Clostridiales bacterium]